MRVALRVKNGDGVVRVATCVTVRTAFSRCHACLRLAARRQWSREIPEGRRAAGRRFRHVSTGAAISTAKGGRARLEASQGTSSTDQSKIRRRCPELRRQIEWKVTWCLRATRVNERYVLQLHKSTAGFHSLTFTGDICAYTKEY